MKLKASATVVITVVVAVVVVVARVRSKCGLRSRLYVFLNVYVRLRFSREGGKEVTPRLFLSRWAYKNLYVALVDV